MPRGWRALQATTVVGALRRSLVGLARPSRALRSDSDASRSGESDAVARGVASPEDAAVGEIHGSAEAGGSGARGSVVPWRGRTLPHVPRAAGSGPEVATAIRKRALAAGLPAEAAAALEERWPELPATTRQQVAAPLQPTGTHVRWGTDVALQTDATTCGSAALAMLAAAGDPGLALWLATGEDLPGYVPAEVRFLRRIRPGALPASPQRRFAAVQLTIKYVTNQIGPFAWPHALGTPPWGAARAARLGPVRFRGELVDDGDRQRTTTQLARAAGAVEAGIPVPLYVQGDLGGGVAHAVPRHVVLLTGIDGDAFTVYEPSEGLATRIARADLLAPRGPQRALGGWHHAAWILLPRP